LLLSREASDVQISLLKTYDVEEASTATDDAHRCIVDVIADPEALLLDHLLALPPIKSLKGTDIYKVCKSLFCLMIRMSL
jgi:translation initiation factor 3 subunit M